MRFMVNEEELAGLVRAHIKAKCDIELNPENVRFETEDEILYAVYDEASEE